VFISKSVQVKSFRICKVDFDIEMSGILRINNLMRIVVAADEGD
jgi:hypothetical protein